MVTTQELEERNKEFAYLINELKRYYEPWYIESHTNREEIDAHCMWQCDTLKGQYTIRLHKNCKLSVYYYEHIACPEPYELERLNPIGQSLTSLFPYITKIIDKAELYIKEKRNTIKQAKRRATIARKKEQANG